MIYQLIARMHEHFKISYDGPPRELSEEEYQFRLTAFGEEITEYIDAREDGDLEGQFDALLDLIVFALGACHLHGFDVDEGMTRVMQANMQKRVVLSAEESKRGHKYDLIKPDGWRAPYLEDLISPPNHHTGIIILEGPDGCGKTTLAEYFVEHYNAHYMHSTWSKEIDEYMFQYMQSTLDAAGRISKNQLVILDRHWLSDCVYGDVFREGCYRGDLYNGMHHQFFREDNRHMIYCLPEDKEAANQHFKNLAGTRPEMYDSMHDVSLAYESLWKGVEIPYEFKYFHSYIQFLVGKTRAQNRLKSNPKVTRYDFLTQGNDLKTLSENILTKMGEM